MSALPTAAATSTRFDARRSEREENIVCTHARASRYLSIRATSLPRVCLCIRASLVERSYGLHIVRRWRPASSLMSERCVCTRGRDKTRSHRDDCPRQLFPSSCLLSVAKVSKISLRIFDLSCSVRDPFRRSRVHHALPLLHESSLCKKGTGPEKNTDSREKRTGGRGRVSMKWKLLEWT